MSEVPFSRRHGLFGPRVGTLIHDDAPNSVRTKLVEFLSSLNLSNLGADFNGVKLHSLFCQVTGDIPLGLENWGNGHLAFGEAKQLIYKCKWFHFYEIVEGLAQRRRKRDPRHGTLFA